MTVHGEVVLRLRFCRNSDCRAMFWICTCCDRGQRYCSGECRVHARHRQHRAANRRHQQSAEGRLDHRDRQRAYRCRRFSRRVTDQGSQAEISHPPSESGKAVTMPALALLHVRPRDRRGNGQRCVVCGRVGRFVDPFPRTSSRR
jgi:hypothetical protein